MKKFTEKFIEGKVRDFIYQKEEVHGGWINEGQKICTLDKIEATPFTGQKRIFD